MNILVINKPTINKEEINNIIYSHKLSSGITFIDMDPDDDLTNKIISTFRSMNDLAIDGATDFMSVYNKTIIINTNDNSINQLTGSLLNAVHQEPMLLHTDKHKRRRMKSNIHLPERRSSDPIIPIKLRQKKT